MYYHLTVNNGVKRMNDDFKDYLSSINRTVKDFYCTKCGEYMLDESALKTFKFRIKRDGSKEPVYNRVYFNNGLIEPKRFNDDISLYRHTCWDCYFKERVKYSDVVRKSRKSKIYSSNKIPRPNVLLPDFFIIYDISMETLADITSAKYNSASKGSFITRFGEFEGLVKYNEYCNRQAYTASSEYFEKEKGMSKAEVKQYHKDRAVTLANLVTRYGKTDGASRYVEYCKTQAYVGCDINYFIEKYGEVDGVKIYNNLTIKKLDNSVTSYKISKISIKLFDTLSTDGSLYGRDEFIIQLDNNTYYLDFLNPSTKKVIEFNGDYWHANPIIYKAHDIIHKDKNITANDIWIKDKKRLDNIKLLGYDVMVVWEKDFRIDSDIVIKKCKEFLYGN